LLNTRQKLQDGCYSYAPFYRLEGAEDPAATPRPFSTAPQPQQQQQPQQQPQTTPGGLFVQLRAPPFISKASGHSVEQDTSISRPSVPYISNTNDPSTLPKPLTAISRPASSLSCHSNSSGSRPSTTITQVHQHQHGTPGGVYSASLRTGSSAGTASSEEATVSNLRGSGRGNNIAHTTQPLTGGILPSSSMVEEGKRPSQPLPTTHTKFSSLGKPMRVANSGGGGGNGGGTAGENGGGHLTSSSIEYIAPLSIPSGSITPAAQFRTPGGVSTSIQKSVAGAPASALRPRLMHTPLVTLMEVPEKTPVQKQQQQQAAVSGRADAAAAAASAAGLRQLVLEDGPTTAMEGPTAQKVQRPPPQQQQQQQQQSSGLSLVGIPEDPGATVPQSRPVAPAVVVPQPQRNMPPPPPVVARPQPPAAPAAPVAFPPSSTTTSNRRVIEDEDTVTVRNIRYTKLECVGRGGSSKVYKVMAPNKKIFALKRIRLTGCDAEAASGFLDEITLLTKLRGKSNIIQLIDSEVHKVQNLIYMVLEYGDIDLARLLQKQEASRREREGPLPQGQMQPADENFIRLYWQQMLQAVDTIHKERIVHSDLKPANFLVVEGQLKLIDFGIAKAIQSDTTSIARESQVGTLNYMSPEAILGGNSGGPRGGPIMKVGRASDIWSLGCIIYQMAFGKTPFAHLPFIQKMHAITNDRHTIEFPPMRNAALLDVIKRCLDRNPRTRITMDELLNHPFLTPTHANANSSGGVELNEEQLRKLLLKVCQTGGVSDANVGQLSGQLFRQLAQGSLSPDVVAAKMGRSQGRVAGDENVRPMHLPPPPLPQ
jgi:serine/threonine-protein kinase TTK/MPS1